MIPSSFEWKGVGVARTCLTPNKELEMSVAQGLADQFGWVTCLPW